MSPGVKERDGQEMGPVVVAKPSCNWSAEKVAQGSRRGETPGCWRRSRSADGFPRQLASPLPATPHLGAAGARSQAPTAGVGGAKILSLFMRTFSIQFTSPFFSWRIILKVGLHFKTS